MKDISMEEINQNEMPQEESVKESVLNETPEMVEEVKQEVKEEIKEDEKPCCEKKKCNIGRLVFDALVAAAIIVLFILHFCGNKESAPVVASGTPNSGEIVFVNIDSINTNYEMVSLLTDSLDAEKQKQTVLFQNRQKALETKLANFQQNYQSGQLTPKQAEYAQMSLQQESEKLQADYAQALESFETRYAAALSQIADSLISATKRINKKRNASYIFTYQTSGQLLYADSTKDITSDVLKELNKPFGKKRKGDK